MFEFENKIDIGDILTLAAIAISLLTYILTQRENSKINRATFLQGYIKQFYDDADMSRLFLKIDYEKFLFNEDVLGTEEEIKIWKLLDLLNSISFHYFNKTIRKNDINMTTLGYVIIRTFQNEGITKYLCHVDKHTNTLEENLKAFGYFRIVAAELAS
jgi:hypothetical protein